MAKFCGKCGTRLDEATGLCPNCDKDALQKRQKAEEKTEKRKQDRAAKKPLDRKKLKKWLLPGIAAVAVIVAVVLILSKCAAGGDDYEVPRVDADEYFEENATVIEQIKVSESADVLTEQDAILLFEERGFTQSPVTTNYTMDGTYGEEQEVSSESTNKHPIYQTLYQNDNGELWTVVIINGQIMANPISYNMLSNRPVKVAFSETSTITSYDSTTDTFYKTIPNESVLKVIKTDQIDAWTLEQFTAEEIEDLW